MGVVYEVICVTLEWYTGEEKYWDIFGCIWGVCFECSQAFLYFLFVSISENVFAVFAIDVD